MRKLYWVFGTAFALFGFLLLAGMMFSLSCAFGFERKDAAPFFAGLIGLLAAGIVWWQGHLIRRQMELQAMIELDREWNSLPMLECRKQAWNSENNPDISNIEGVLEFLEKVSTFEENGFINCDLVWETFGWYLTRYYHYSKAEIENLRRIWTTPHYDLTLYEDLQSLYEKQMRLEVIRRNRKSRVERSRLGNKDLNKLRENPPTNEELAELDLKAVVKELDDTRVAFVEAERGVI